MLSSAIGFVLGYVTSYIFKRNVDRFTLIRNSDTGCYILQSDTGDYDRYSEFIEFLACYTLVSIKKNAPIAKVSLSIEQCKEYYSLFLSQ